jgi:transcriptional regulator with XRE-family HTH domain
MSLGTRLRQLRMGKKESLQALADAIGVSKPHLWELESGRSQNPSLELLQKIARHFGVSIASLVGEAETSSEALVFGRDFSQLPEEDRAMVLELAERLKRRPAG